MRVMLKATLDTEKANEVVRSGRMPELVKETLQRLQPEAAYFGPLGGRRTCLLVLDLADSSQIPAAGDPFFTEFGAEVEMTPVMNAEDLQKGLSQL
ncbi:hypothetical protein G3I31_13625 [Streptomyces sp. SID9913]|jgi:hypothetical protein|uniref:DUF3303 domain-containing protein n=2 Tax=unclassified Streptomyces TaxID=2593676 RepID=A0A6G3QPJ2_9ACTN|nr:MULTISPECIES: hypothetical protein [unclassified Streptomyces]MBM7088556.1 hypothetical protein [Streptomyces sp. S12]NEA85409.1 hypothetical protein [Streptomyces sp. SID14436]NEC81908.1 hypothetical protein [Streptomyces sp. SID7958]NED19146.1 hypothetical protein [Streptomyces sp. SID9913]